MSHFTSDYFRRWKIFLKLFPQPNWIKTIQQNIFSSRSSTCRAVDRSRSTDLRSVCVQTFSTIISTIVFFFFLDTKTNQTFSIGFNETRNYSTMIRLDSTALIQQNRLVFSVYDHQTNLFNDEHHQVLSRVLSLTIDRPDAFESLPSLVTMDFYLKNNFSRTKINIRCAFWKMFQNRTAFWSTDGCSLIGLGDEYIRCQCNHLTHFAILMV